MSDVAVVCEFGSSAETYINLLQCAFVSFFSVSLMLIFYSNFLALLLVCAVSHVFAVYVVIML